MILKYINRFQQIEQLIRQKRTGNADELSKKLGICRRRVYRLLEEFKDLGVSIKYSKNQRSFVFDKDYEIEIKIAVKPLSKAESIENSGGFIQKSFVLYYVTNKYQYCLYKELLPAIRIK